MDNTRESYDEISGAYAAHFLDELPAKPLDRALLDVVAAELDGLGVIADIGCGCGHVARYLHDSGAPVVGLDLSPGMIDTASAAHPALNFRVGDMRKLDVPDQSWGGIVALYSIIHVPPRELAVVFTEFHRTLKPGGLVLLSFHLGDEVRHADEMLGHPVDLDFHFYERQPVQRHLEAAGFEVVAYLDRRPYPHEVATNRGYLLVRRPSFTPGPSPS